MRISKWTSRFVRTAVLALRNYFLHQGGQQAGSMAFSSLLSMFPLLILVSALAPYIGEPGNVATLAERVIGYAPEIVRDAIRPAVGQVLAQRNQALLALGVIGTVWTSSSGMQSIRAALNRSYGVDRGLPFWKARLKVTLFTAVVGAGGLAAFSSVIILPYFWHLLQADAAGGLHAILLNDALRYGGAFVLLAVLYALMYGWLPDIHQRISTILPGALIGAALWVAAAASLSYTLRTASRLVLIYGGFAGVVATLVFLYISAATLIYGAEFNAVLREEDTAHPSSP